VVVLIRVSAASSGQVRICLRVPPGGGGNPLSGYDIGGVSFYLETCGDLEEAWGRNLLGIDAAVYEEVDDSGWRVLQIPVLAPVSGKGLFFRLVAVLQ